ncbi:DeoR family transcriptional regulator [Yoonia sp. MH D7]
MADLNTPDTRETTLRTRIREGVPLVAADLAAELDTSIHTIRRDLIALERKGLVRRVRGGAMPLTGSTPSYAARVGGADKALVPLAARAVRTIPETGTVFLDGGTTLLAVAGHLPENFRGLVVTPAPAVAMAAMARGARVQLIGGVLCPEGAMATGGAGVTTRRSHDRRRLVHARSLRPVACLWP